MKTKTCNHTPGPWYHVHGNQIHDKTMQRDEQGAWIGERPNMIAEVEYPYSDPDGQAANARLIAAAPEMLEALEAVAKLIKTARNYFPQSMHNSDKFNLELVCGSVSRAIANAQG